MASSNTEDLVGILGVASFLPSPAAPAVILSTPPAQVEEVIQVEETIEVVEESKEEPVEEIIQLNQTLRFQQLAQQSEPATKQKKRRREQETGSKTSKKKKSKSS